MATILDIALGIDDHDLTFDGDGFLVLAEDAPVVAQRVEIRLKTQTGEWDLDTEMGIDWIGTVLVKAPDLNTIRALFARQILQPDEVRSLTALELVTDAAARSLVVNFAASTAVGLIEGTA